MTSLGTQLLFPCQLVEFWYHTNMLLEKTDKCCLPVRTHVSVSAAYMKKIIIAYLDPHAHIGDASSVLPCRPPSHTYPFLSHSLPAEVGKEDNEHWRWSEPKAFLQWWGPKQRIRTLAWQQAKLCLSLTGSAHSSKGSEEGEVVPTLRLHAQMSSDDAGSRK
jgi:hypothetical protein